MAQAGLPRGGLARADLAVRAAQDDDITFLRDLYATTRADELAHMPWPDTAKAVFLDQQFAAQHRHFIGMFANADFLVITRRGRPVGRLYLDRTGEVWRIVDIALLPALRGAGAGTALLRWVQAAARTAKAQGVDLHVLPTNSGAARLYTKLGFVDVANLTNVAGGADLTANASHRRMIWRVS